MKAHWVILQGHEDKWQVVEWLPDGHPLATHWESWTGDGELKICCKWHNVEADGEKSGFAVTNDTFIVHIRDGEVFRGGSSLWHSRQNEDVARK